LCLRSELARASSYSTLASHNKGLDASLHIGPDGNGTKEKTFLLSVSFFLGFLSYYSIFNDQSKTPFSQDVRAII